MYLFLLSVFGPLTLIGHSDSCIKRFDAQESNSNSESIVAKKIIGTWIVEKTISKRLVGDSEVRMKRLVFKKDDSTHKFVTEKYKKLMPGPIYLAGTVSVYDKNRPFLLSLHKGNPYLIIGFGPEDDPFQSIRENFVCVAGAKTKNKDLLFVGGESLNAPYIAYSRKNENHSK